MKQLTTNITIPFTIFKEGKAYIAYSPALDIATSGETFEIAKKRFPKILEIFLEECTKINTAH